VLGRSGAKTSKSGLKKELKIESIQHSISFHIKKPPGFTIFLKNGPDRIDHQKLFEKIQFH
jgi:hypothetical protein